jgi:hypothetical protein
VIGRVEVDDRPRQITHGGGHDVTVLNEHPTTTIYYGGPSVSSVAAVGSLAPGASVQLTTPFYVVTAPFKRGQVLVGRVTPVWGGGTLPQTVGAQDPDPVLSVYGAPHSLQQDGGGVLPQRSSLNIISPLIVFDDSIGGTSNLAFGSSPHFEGDPTAVTQALADNSPKLATTAYVDRAAIPMQLVDAKGDLLAGSGDNAVVRVVVGGDGQVLTADAASPAGVKWGATIAGALSALSASVPDKLRWQYPGGTDVVEFYGSAIVAGLNLTGTEDFTTVTSPKARFNVVSDDAGKVIWSGDVVTASTRNATAQFTRRDAGWGASGDTARVQIRFKFGNFTNGGFLSVGFADRTTGHIIGTHFDPNPSFQGEIKTVALDDFSNVTSYAAVAGMANNTFYKLRFERSGSTMIASLLTDDELTVLRTGSAAIPAGLVAELGAGKPLDPYFVLGAWDTPITVDDMVVYNNVGEQHDAFVAVTPLGAARTVKRLFGSVGTTFRSDFLLAADQIPETQITNLVADLAAKAALASPSLTGSPTAPTQTAADGSTKLATTAYADRLAQQVFAINTQAGTAYTAVLADAGKVIESNNASAMTVTIPPNSSVAYPVGSRLRGTRLGAGTLTIVQGAGVVLRNRIEAAGTTNRTVPAQYGMWEAYKRGTDEWVLTGDIA